MFEREETTPWYRSLTGIIATGVLLPPVGLVLVWLRKDWATKVKIAGTVALVLLSVSYIFLARAWRRHDVYDAQYAALEQHRLQQQSQTPATTTDPATAANTGHPVQAQPGQPTAGAPGAVSSETASAHATRNYWTNFRGPQRDGHYQEMAVNTNWPSQGLTPIWKQPIGQGYSSFVVADGRAQRL